MACILVVEDQPLVLRAMRIILEQAGHVVFGARDGQECDDVLQFARPDVVVMDLFMPRRSGLEAIRVIRQGQLPCRILAVSGGDPAARTDPLALAHELGAEATLSKPFDDGELLQAIDGLLPERLRR